VLADEQAALRRVAELVARGAALDEVFEAVATEASKLLGGRPVRVQSVHGTPPTELDPRAGVAVPVSVEGRVWGVLTASTQGPPLPAGTEQRLMQFAELAAAAIANAENKDKLTASRARVVATADETRRRLQRDVHDSAQQRLVHTIITLKLARDAIAAGDSAAELVEEALINAERANAELRDVVRGILPAALTRGGLQTGLESLVADLAVPVDVRVTVPRLSAETETTAYFIVAEALTNVVKHARATRATVEVDIEAERLSIHVHDDGVGGADPAGGTGLTGMLDRVEAGEGTLDITSPAGIGTTLHATLPLRERIPPE
jgi:signal transduction histidine kinase